MIAVTIFSAVIVREILTPLKATCVLVCLGGVVMVSNVVLACFFCFVHMG